MSRRMLVEEKEAEAEDRLLERAKEPPYDFTLVPSCTHDLVDSVVIRVASRRMCTYAIGEIFHVCNEAARRQAIRRQQVQQALDSNADTKAVPSSASSSSSDEKAAAAKGEDDKVASAPEDDSGGDNSSSSPVVGDASKSKSKAGKAESKAKSKASKSKTESKATNGAHPVPMEQDAPPTLPGQPPASPTIKYVYPDANTFEKGEIILCPTCKKNMKAPMRARALRCANCRFEIYPRHRKPGCADALRPRSSSVPAAQSNTATRKPATAAVSNKSGAAAPNTMKETAASGATAGSGVVSTLDTCE